jgi:hypothetical protein
MNNPMLEQLAQLQSTQPQQTQMSPQNLDQIKSMYQAVKNAGNPDYVVAQMMNQNPLFRQVADYAHRNGCTYKAAFYKLAQEQGLNPEAALRMLSN